MNLEVSCPTTFVYIKTTKLKSKSFRLFARGFSCQRLFFIRNNGNLGTTGKSGLRIPSISRDHRSSGAVRTFLFTRKRSIKKKDIFGSPPLQANTFLGNLSVHYCLVIMVPMVATLFIAGGLIDCIRFGIFCLNFTGRRLIYSVILLSKSKTTSQLTGNTNTPQSELYLSRKTPACQCTSMFFAFHAVISHSFLGNFLFKAMITGQPFIFPELTNYTRLCSPREDRMPDGILIKKHLTKAGLLCPVLDGNGNLL